MEIPQEHLKQCWFLAGPTACGKSESALCLAEKLNAEIISLDSMAIYRSMDIGTAKPSRDDRDRIRHHLIDLIEPTAEFSVAEYVAAAASACGEILARDRVPLFVGGTGLYLRGVLRGVFVGPAADWEIRSRLEHEEAQHGAGYLHSALQQRDPDSAARIHPNDQRRIVRALEVLELTGQPLSSQQRQLPFSPEMRPEHVYWLSPPRDWLHERINLRVSHMLHQGLISEVEGLLAMEGQLSHTARQALGYKEVIDYIDGDVDLATCESLIQTRTRQFAKRQCTWFRNLEECQELKIAGSESANEIAELVLRQ